MSEEPDSGAAPGGESAEERTGPTKSELKRAMKAFRKRIQLMRLDDESTIGGSAMSGGRESSIVAIMPPHGFSDEVWEELVRLGRLRDGGGGTYEIVE